MYNTLYKKYLASKMLSIISCTQVINIILFAQNIMNFSFEVLLSGIFSPLFYIFIWQPGIFIYYLQLLKQVKNIFSLYIGLIFFTHMVRRF